MPDSPGERPAGTLHLSARHRAMLEALLQEHLPEVEVWAYGSRVNGQSHDGSDLDLVLRGPGLAKIDITRLVDFEEALRDSTVPFLVEAHDWARLPESFHREIERRHVVLTERKNEDSVSEWREYTWGDLATLEYGRALRGYRSRKGPYRVFGTNGPIGWHTDALYNGPSVIVGRKGAYRGVHYAPDPFFVIDTAFYLKPKTQFDVRWAYYELLLHDINSMDTGSAIPSTSRDSFYDLPVRVPPLTEQREIAHILGTLDDKIELNRRMNETLDAMVRALFKSWFIDFDPVRVKMEGRYYTGRPEYGTDQFPDSFARSEIGDVPEGWKVVPVAELIEVNPTRRLRKREIAPYVDMANMPMSGHTPHMVTERPYGSGMRFINGDTLVARITPCLENGKTAYVDFLEPNATGWGSTEFIVMRPRPPLPNVFAYCLARSPRFRAFLIRNMSGTSGRQRVSPQVLSQYRFPIPGEQIARTFGEMAGPLIARASAAARESRRLADLRDALLPELISGRRPVGRGFA